MTTFAQMTVAGGAMIAVTTLLRLTLRDRLPRAAYLFFWGAAMARLLTPVTWVSPIGLFGRTSSAAAAPDTLSPLPVSPQTDRYDPLFFLWLGGMLLCVTWFLAREISARRALRTAVRVQTPAVEALLSQFAFWRRVQVRSDHRLSAPVTYGLIRPVVILPDGLAQTDCAALRFSLLHELCHVRHGDYLWKTLAACAVCVHWFNPLVWLLFVLLDRDLEMYCDEQVLRRCLPTERAAYAHCLLDFASWASPSLLASHLKQKPLEERILVMMTSRKVSIAGLTLATALIVGTTSAFAASDNGTDANMAATLTPASTQSVLVNADVQKGQDDGSLAVTVTDATDAAEFHLDASKLIKMDDGTYRYTFEDGSVATVVSATETENAQQATPDAQP